MERDCHDSSGPSNVVPVEVVDLETEGEQETFFESLLQDCPDDLACASPQLDNVSEKTLEGWDTYVVETNNGRSHDKAIPKRDYDALLMTARLSVMEDKQLQLPWESGIFKSIFDDHATVSLLPAQVLTVTGDVFCTPSSEGAASSSVVPEPKQFPWLARDVVLPIHACAIKVLPDRDFFQELDVLWVHAVDKWLRIFEILGYPGVLGESIALEMYSPDGGKSREMVRDSMGIKSPRTAIKGAQTILKYFT